MTTQRIPSSLAWLLMLLLCASTAHAFVFPAAPQSTTSIPTLLHADPSTTQQASYGTDLAFPTSYVRCGSCDSVYALTESDLGERGRGRRLECSVCGHSWFQSKDRILTLNDDLEFISLPQRDLERIAKNMQEKKPPKYMGEMKLYVGNVAFECHEEDLFTIFGKLGEVGQVSLVRDSDGKNRGFGFITMRDKEAGKKAIDELDGSTVRGRRIAVRESNN